MMLAMHDRPSHLDPFAFRLAAELGMTVGELEERMSGQEYLEWHAYHTARDAILSVRRG